MTGNAFENLGKDVAEALGEAPSTPSSPEQASLLHHMERAYRRRRRNGVMVTATLSLALLGLGLYWAVGPEQAPTLELRHPGGKVVALGEWISPRAEPVTLRGEEGSELVISRGSRARISHLDRKSIRVALESGRLRASVHHRKAFNWSFRAGPYEVEVVGTQLAIDWAAGQGALAVQVREGAVRVRGDHLGRGGMMVRAGQRLRASHEERAVSITPVDAPASAPEVDTGVAADAGSRAPADLGVAARRPTQKPPSMRWRKLARAGDFGAAAREARRAGLSRLLARLDAPNLMLLADAGRLGRDAALAVSAYRALRRRAKGSKQATLAAFRLGRLHYEQRRDYARAARAFAQYLKEAPRGPFAADARGRQMMALKRAGKLEAAREVAKRYLALHPGGAYASSAKALLAR